MVGDRKREQLAATIKQAADKAGGLVTAALGVACTALLIAVVALVAVLRMRVSHAG